MKLSSSLALVLATVVSATLTGCTLQQDNLPSTFPGTSLSGHVHGGQQPVTGATIQLYAAGTNGYASAATPLIPAGSYYLGGAPGCVASTSQTCYPGVVTDANGAFALSGDYTCPSGTSQIYLTAAGGNPGLTAGTNNTALTLMVALGSCSTLATIPFISVNELTTVAATYALAQFMSGPANVGSSSTNSAGIAKAMLNAQAIVNSSVGAATAVGSPATGYTYAILYPQYTVNTLGNILAACVNSNGSTSSGTACYQLFAAATPPGGTAPADTITAALNIALHPGNNVSSVFALAAANTPFQPALAATPNDWMMPILYQKYAKFLVDFALDGNGNFWDLHSYYGCYADSVNLKTEVQIVFSGGACSSVAITPAGNLWTYDSLNQETYVVSPTDTFVSTYIRSSPAAYNLAFDSNGYLWGTSLSTINVFSNTATFINSATATDLGKPRADSAGGVWHVSANTLNRYSLSGTTISSASYTGGNLSSPVDLAIDHTGNIWALNTNNSLSEFTSSGSPITTASAYTGGGLDISSSTAGPTAGSLVAVDGLGNIWVANNGGNTISEFTNAGVPVSTSAGYGAYVSANSAATAGEYILDQPTNIAVDLAGDVWVGGTSNLTPYGILGVIEVTTFLGAAAPTLQPLSVAASNNALGTRP